MYGQSHTINDIHNDVHSPWDRVCFSLAILTNVLYALHAHSPDTKQIGL
uniref:Uncharacterized protein n=1 Tax=Lepeophtheirus salmonis TaxID=72036 RepID=A0A0K2VB04_LEPSM